MKEEKQLLNYNEVIQEVEDEENHLLIGNGFNRSLGINTSYESIFERMIDNKPSVYEEARSMVKEYHYDLEAFIGKLESDIDDNNSFLKKFARNKIKLDFMQATHEIVKESIKNIYAEKNKGIFILLRNFTNYFSLNYDSFLYLLLLKYKAANSDEKDAIALQPTLNFIEKDLNEKQNNIYKEIKDARDKGMLGINVGDKTLLMEKPLKELTKSYLVPTITQYSKYHNKGWKRKDIEIVVESILQEEKQNNMLNRVDDGSRQLSLFGDTEFVFDLDSETQNLFFLHGAFHIYKDGRSIKKITQKTDKALYDRLEEIINDDEKDIVCVFQHEKKTDAINNNQYLQKCFNKLRELSGNLVIIGSSLADNDNHIFEKINDSSIETIYLSTLNTKKEEFFKLAREKFPLKNISLFDAETISYSYTEQLVK